MRIKNDQAGLTLVELLVTIVVASIVTLAACTMLLFGLRINNQSTKTSMGQNTVQVLMKALEDVAAEAENLVVVEEVGENGNKWKLYDKNNGKTFFSYKENVIYSGNCDDISALPFLEGIEESYASFQHNKLLTVYVKTQSGEYENSIYCRTATGYDAEDDIEKGIIDYLAGKVSSLPNGISITGDSSRLEFLRVLAGQYGSDGKEIKSDETYGDYYSEWYLNVRYLNDKGYENNPSWNKDTPWCACYLSWAIAQEQVSIQSNKRFCEANVEKLKNCFVYPEWKEKNVDFESGDLIFFNFDTDKEADHVGVVLAMEGDYIYTIEGNTAGKVAVRKYDKNDKRILGYGVLRWTS